ncbi:MAG: serine/threonine protein kinase [Turneriella sp.]
METSAPTEFFYRLTPDEILDAVTRLGLEPSGHISQLNSMENRVFDLRLDDGRHIVTKFYRPGRWSREQILEEHAFLADLASDEVPALSPLRIGNETLFEEQGIFFALWPRTGGREPEELSDIDLQILGRLLARLHNTGAGGSMPHRPQFTTQRFLAEPLGELLSRGFLKENFSAEYSALVDEIAAAFDDDATHLPLIRIHGDLHKGNILCGSDGHRLSGPMAGSWFLLDFDDSLSGPALQDVWMLFSPEDRAARDTFLAAYREFRDFDEAWLHCAEILRAMRIVHYSGWIARRYEDPAFTAAFPDFASDSYWEEEIRILREITSALKPDNQKNNGNTLSNKDYFFDYDD